MRPAFPIIFLTTLIGTGQGLLLTLYIDELRHGDASGPFYTVGLALVLGLCLLGLAASYFHLGQPARAWRAVLMWRTSWLSREIIALLAFIASVSAYFGTHLMGSPYAMLFGGVAAFCSLALFVCTGMVYVAIRVMKEWATPLTVLNFLLMGCASGATLAGALAMALAPDRSAGQALTAFTLTLAALSGRAFSLARNAGLKPDTTLQSALGIRHPRIVQKSQGAMGGSFNTREFFHGKSRAFLRTIKPAFLILAFLAPLGLLALGHTVPGLLPVAFLLQYLGLLAERWFFFAEANHPQNLYYQVIS